LTTTILGAVLSASTVSAQQSPPTAGIAPGPASGPAGDSDAGFGMAAARGARHLLRNGLDYIEYQEFDRALKYLREAERRQAELNEPERAKLKQALDRAQRGTRESIGSEKPYALSQRSLRSGGFTAAEPAAVAASKPRAASREGDDRAEPIQLAGAEAPAPAPVRASSRLAAAPAPLPEVPEAPAPSGLAPAPARADDAAPSLAAMPAAPPVTPIEPARLPALAAAPAGRDAAQAAQADLTSPLPALDAPPALDDAVARSAAAPAAPAPIELERPEDLEAPAAEPTPVPVAPAPRASAMELPGLDAVEIRDEPEAPAPAEPAPAADEAPVTGLDDPTLDLPALPADLRERTAPAAEPAPAPAPAAEAPAEDEALPTLPGDLATDAAMPEPEPAALAEPAAEAEPAPLAEPSPIPTQAPAVEAAPAPAAAPELEAEPEPAVADEGLPDPAEGLPTLPSEMADAPAPAAAPAPTAVPDFAPAPSAAPSPDSPFIPRRAAAASTLSPELERRVEELAKRQEEEARGRIAARTRQEAEPVRDEPVADLSSDVRTQTQIDISRAPSPAEARPISAIPVPEDWVPLGARSWSPQRKYWSAAATCHLPLYFQDPMLERYGHSVENYIGAKGRFFTYPVDNHKQTTQRNQIAQPFASAGLFAFQILTLPYALIMDPPWEAQYDLGYWRPGDKIPTDMYYLPLHGTGEPLKGSNY